MLHRVGEETKVDRCCSFGAPDLSSIGTFVHLSKGFLRHARWLALFLYRNLTHRSQDLGEVLSFIPVLNPSPLLPPPFKCAQSTLSSYPCRKDFMKKLRGRWIVLTLPPTPHPPKKDIRKGHLRHVQKDL